MFRIDEMHTNGGTTLALAGVLDAQGAAEVTRALGGLRQNGRRTLNLRQIRYADRDGVVFLISAVRAGVQLTGVPLYIRTWLGHEGLLLNEKAPE